MTATLAEAWDAVGGDPALLSLVDVGPVRREVESSLAVGELASASVTAAILAAAELLAARRGEDTSPVVVDPDHAFAAFASERHLELDGTPADPGWDPLSRFWRAADGWIRLQCNYPHHRARALAVLRHPRSPAQAIAKRSALELEDEIVAAGGCAAAVRNEDEWRRHPQGAAALGQPLVHIREREAPVLATAQPGAIVRPAQGVRVLDLTRVIAGPTCTRFLAAHGAEVLRVDPPALPELRGHHLDGNWGKRSARLDLGVQADRDAFERLLETTDVLIHGYRPGALDRFGLAPAAVAERHPGIITISLSAWGPGPWEQRRGFDSIVQAASGIARAEGGGQDDPWALPVQALDHATAYLAAAAGLRALTRRARGAVCSDASLSLARTARWLLDQPRTPCPASDARPARTPFTVRRDSVHGTLTSVPPPGRILGEPPPEWRPPGLYGADPPRWSAEG